MSAIIAAVRHFVRELKWKARHATFGVLIWVLRHQPADPKSFFAPFFDRVEEAIDKMFREDQQEGRREQFASIGWSWDAYLDQVGEDVVARADMASMGDASFQLWLDQKFPDMPVDLRANAVEHYRNGTL